MFYSTLSPVKLIYLTQQVIFLLDKMVEIGLLFDFYGKLLTPRQQEIITLYYYEDFSLGEIAEKLNISRQGVFDHIHRSEDLLRNYEKQLGLVQKYTRLKASIDNLIKYVNGINLEDDVKDKLQERIGDIKNNL